jgi:mono/diheme cytochrome c family protein
VGGLQTDWVTEFDRNTEGDALQNPYGAADAHTLAKGKRLFQVSCAPCHGIDGTGGGPVTQNDPAKGLNRFPIPAPMLSGEGAVTGMRSDGYLYLTIRDGGAGLGAGMPPYATSLTDRERWAIVSYMRTLEGGAAPPPPAPVETTVPGQEG